MRSNSGLSQYALHALALALSGSALGCGRADSATNDAASVALASSRYALDLQERFAVEVPEFGGVVAVGRESYVAWTTDRPASLVLIDHSGYRKMVSGLAEAPLAVAADESGGGVELISTSGEYRHFDIDGTLGRSGRIVSGVTLLAAARSRVDWWLFAVDSLQGPELLRVRDGRVVQRRRFELPGGDSHRPHWQDGLYLAALDSAVAVQEAVAPFRLVVVDLDGGIRYTHHLLSSPLVSSRIESGSPSSRTTSSARQWRAFRPVQIDDVLLVTLSDLSSDNRIFVVVQPSLGVVRATSLSVPLGFAGATRDSLLLAARRTDRFELVGYEWGWTQDQSRGGKP